MPFEISFLLDSCAPIARETTCNNCIPISQRLAINANQKYLSGLHSLDNPENIHITAKKRSTAMQLLVWIPAVLGCLLPICIPSAHMAVLLFYWQTYSRNVDRRFCSCSCWDTVFKGKLLSMRCGHLSFRLY